MRSCCFSLKLLAPLGVLLLLSCGSASGPDQTPPRPDSECPAYKVEGLEVSCVTHRRATYVVLRVDLKQARIKTLWKNPSGAPYSSLEQAYSQLGNRPLALTNGGIYSAAHDPEGLHIEDGEMLSPLNLNGGEGNFYLRPNGVFYVTDEGAGVIVSEKFDSLSWRARVQEATQSGPLLVVGGEVNPDFKPDSQSLYVRNGVGVKSPAEVYLVVSESAVNLYDFASLFKEELHCRDALYLDGCVSQMYLPARGVKVPERRQCDKELVGLLGVFKRE